MHLLTYRRQKWNPFLHLSLLLLAFILVSVIISICCPIHLFLLRHWIELVSTNIFITYCISNSRISPACTILRKIKININLNFLFINNDFISGNGFQCYKCLSYEDCYENGTIGSIDTCNKGINACVTITLEEGKLCPKT